MPSSATDRIDGLTTSVAIKAPCSVATTANITLSGLQTIDGVTIVADDRVLVKNQTAAAENGIWVAQSTAWSRARDFNGARDAVQGTLVAIHSGTQYARTIWQVSTVNPIYIGTTELSFEVANDVAFTQALAASSGSSLVGHISSGSGATARTVQAKLRDVVSIKDFGAVGDYDTDDTAAIVAALAAVAASNRCVLYVPAGVYRVTEGITLPERIKIIGEGAPKIATFNQHGGDKDLLRPGYKGQISGSVFVFDGTPTLTFTTARADKFASQKPMVLYNHQSACQIKGIGFIQDMDVRDAGGTLTTGATDNRASDYTAGLVMLCNQGLLEDATVFGYFTNAGLIITNKDGDSLIDPDYNRISNCLISGGTAIIGNDTAVSEGLTGTLSLGSGFYGSDHHTRADSNPDIPCLYIDGNLTSSAEIRGHSFVGCNFRTVANTAISLDHCDDVSIVGSITEFSTVAGVTGLDANGTIVGTANTLNVRLLGVAATDDLGIPTLISTISGKFQIVGSGGFDHAYFGHDGKGVMVGGNATTGDSFVQLTDDFTSTTSQWVIQRDDDASDLLDMRYAGTSVFSIDTTGAIGRLALRSGSLTIASDAITIGSLSSYSVDTEGAAASDDLATINGGVAGQILFLRAANASRTVNLVETGNIRMSSTGFALDNSLDETMLRFDGTNWRGVSTSDNGA